MTLTVVPSNPFRVSWDNGVSSAASIVRRSFEETNDETYRTYSLGEPRLDAHQTLIEVYLEARENNWDGHGAKAVNQRIFYNASRFIDSLPLTFLPLDISSDPDGEISFDWKTGPHKVFSVSIGEGDELSYAGLFGRNNTYGSEIFIDEFPQAIAGYLARIFAKNR